MEGEVGPGEEAGEEERLSINREEKRFVRGDWGGGADMTGDRS